MALSFVVILFFGKRLPKKGAEIGIACRRRLLRARPRSPAYQWIDRVNDAAGRPRRGARRCTRAGPGGGATAEEERPRRRARSTTTRSSRSLTEATWFTIGGHDFKVGTFVDGLTVMMLLVVTHRSRCSCTSTRTDYVGGDRRYTHYFAFLSLFTASMLLLVISQQHAAVHHRLGAGRRLLVRAHRPLVGGEAELRRRAQGVPHQPRRRHRPARRHDHPVLRRRHASTSSRSTSWPTHGEIAPPAAARRQPAA